MYFFFCIISHDCNDKHIYIYFLQVTCQLAKEIQLKHRAPVIGITVLDGAAVPLPDPLEVFE